MNKKSISSFQLWCQQILLWPAQFSFVMFTIVLMIPFSLCLLVLMPYFIQTINSTPADVLWQNLFGAQLAALIQPFFAGTEFAKSIPLSFQKEWFALIFAFTAAIYALLNFYSDYRLRDLGEKLAEKLRADIVQKYLKLNYAAAVSVDAGLLASMVGEDMREVQQTFTRLISSLLKDGFISVIFLGWLIILDPQLFVLFLTVLVPAGIVLRVTSKQLKKLSRQGLQFETELLSGLLERMRGWQTIQVHKAIPFEIVKFNKINDKIYHAWRKVTRAKTLGSPLVEWLGIIAGALLVITALRRITEGSISSQVLVSFMVTVGFLTDKINRITGQLNTTRKGIDALHRIHHFLLSDLPQRETINGKIPSSSSQSVESLEIKNLAIGNPNTEILAEDINLNLLRRDFLAITGPSGVGKSTFIRVVLGLQPSIKGDIYINGEKIDEALFQNISKNICFIPQEPFLFSGSIFENIAYPSSVEHPEEQDLEKARIALNLALLERDLNENIHGLSGGEKQRLMFARIFYRSPDLIVIDEGTSALDLGNEIKIMDNLKKHAASSIILVIAHRKAIQTYATQILNMNKGS